MTTPDPTKLADELERAAKGSTPGPWEYETDQEGSSMGWIGRQIQYHPERSYTVFSSMFEVEGDSAEQAINAELVVTLVNNLPAILDALRRSTPPSDVAKLREALVKARKGFASIRDDRNGISKSCRAEHELKAIDAALASQDAPSAPPSDEVERIVAWLRKQAHGRARDANTIENREVRLTCHGYAMEYNTIASAIKRGDWRNSAALQETKP